MKAIFTIGVSASGKSTWAHQQRGYRVVDRDKIRQRVLKLHVPEFNKQRENMWYYWNWTWEDEVTIQERNQIMHHIMMNEDIIICETGLGIKQDVSYISEIVKLLDTADYEISYHYQQIELDEAIRRDRTRLHSVGDYVINQQWCNWLRLTGEKTGIRRYVKDSSKTPCIVVDIDGTVARNMGRPPFEWSRVGEDTPILEITNLVKLYSKSDYTVIFLTGRSEECRQITTTWLKKHVVNGFELFMRPKDNYEKDRVIKERLFFDKVEPAYNVEFVIDDRKQVINLWTDIGVKVLNVGNIYETF